MLQSSKFACPSALSTIERTREIREYLRKIIACFSNYLSVCSPNVFYLCGHKMKAAKAILKPRGHKIYIFVHHFQKILLLQIIADFGYK